MIVLTIFSGQNCDIKSLLSVIYSNTCHNFPPSLLLLLWWLFFNGKKLISDQSKNYLTDFFWMEYIEMYEKGKCIAKRAFNWKSIGKFCNDSFCISYQKQKKETVKQSAVNFWRLPESTRVTANYEIATPLVSSTQAIITTIISGFLPNIHGLEWEIK